MEQVARCAAPRERLHQLLRRPFRSGMGGDVEMEEAPPIVRQDDKDIENSKSDGRHDEEVRRDQLPHVVIKEGTPGLGWWFSLASHVLRDSRLGHFDTEFEQFPMDTRCAPERIRQTHFSDQFPNVQVDRRPSWLALPTLPSPIPAESSSLPSDNRFGLHKEQH